jgi:hypothetical protein
VGFVVGLAGGVAGCTNYPEPSHLPTPTETVTPSPSPTPTPTATPDAASVPPERPAAMDVVDSAGAEAVAVYFLELYAYVYATNDLTEWRDLSHPECIFCASVITNVEEQIANGHRSDGGLAEFESVTSSEVSPGFFNVVIIATQGPSNEYGPDGSVVEHSDGNRSVLTLVVLSTAAGWRVRGVDVAPAP